MRRAFVIRQLHRYADGGTIAAALARETGQIGPLKISYGSDSDVLSASVMSVMEQVRMGVKNKGRICSITPIGTTVEELKCAL
jgi:hypothetical protein